VTTEHAITDVDMILKDIEDLSRGKFLPIIGPVKGKYLAEAVRKYNVRKVLEIGTLVGYSAMLIAKNLPGDGKVFTIEINPQSAKSAEKNISKAGLVKKIKIYIGNALIVIPEIMEEFEMVFIDAAKDEYLDYLRLCEPKLKKNGIVFSDNVKIFADQMQDFLDYLRNSGKYKSQYIDVGFDGVEISEKLF
jgi:predicted O-methyltransferase YrrM